MKSDSGIPVEGIIKKYGADRSALLEILKEVKDISGVITDDSIDKISGQLNM
jgi:NADH:ubiquinone oxidoreductase subunit E